MPAHPHGDNRLIRDDKSDVIRAVTQTGNHERKWACHLTIEAVATFLSATSGDVSRRVLCTCAYLESK